MAVSLGVVERVSYVLDLCLHQLVHQPTRTTVNSDGKQISTSPCLAPPRPCVRTTSLRTLAGLLFLPRSRLVCTLYLGYHPDRRRCIASEHRAWPLVRSFSLLHIYVAPQHQGLTFIHRAVLPSVSGPLGPGLCTILHPNFGEYPFHALR